MGSFRSEDSGDPRESDTHRRMTTRSGQRYKDSPMQREGELESGNGGGPGRLPEGGYGDGGMATFFHMLQAQQEQQQRWMQAQQEEHHRRR